MGGAAGIRKSIEKTSSRKNRAIVLWEYYNERGNLQIFRKLSILLKQYLAGTQDRTAVIVMKIVAFTEHCQCSKCFTSGNAFNPHASTP